MPEEFFVTTRAFARTWSGQKLYKLPAVSRRSQATSRSWLAKKGPSTNGRVPEAGTHYFTSQLKRLEEWEDRGARVRSDGSDHAIEQSKSGRGSTDAIAPLKGKQS